jgi:membrane protein
VSGQAVRDGRKPALVAPATRSPRFTLARQIATKAHAEVRLGLLAIWRGVTGFYNSDDMTFASSIAYYALLSLFPFFLLAFAILGNATSNEGDRVAIFNFVLRYFPRQFDFISTQLTAFEQARIRLGVAGSIIMVWAAMGVFGALTSAINHAWGVDKQPNYFKHKLISFLMLAMSGVLLLLGLLMVSAINVAEASWFASVLARWPKLLVLQSLAIKWASTVIFILIVGLVFYFVPNAKVRFRDVWLGAILTGLLWRGALAGFSRYVRDLSRFSVHGSIAAVVVFLFWIFISAIILLYGVEVTAAYARLRRKRPDEIPAAPAPRL